MTIEQHDTIEVAGRVGSVIAVYDKGWLRVLFRDTKGIEFVRASKAVLLPDPVYFPAEHYQEES
jgi:hypothetical protein